MLLPLCLFFHDPANVRHLMDDTIRPSSVLSIGIDCRNPSLGRRRLHLFKRIIALCFHNQVADFLAVVLQPNQKIRHVIMHLAVVHVGDCKAQSGVLGEGQHVRMFVQIISGGLFPPLCICDNIVKM